MAPAPTAPAAAPINPANLSQPMGHNFGQVAAPQAHGYAPAPMDLTQPVGAPAAAPLNFAQPAPPAPLDMTQPMPPGLNMTRPVPQPQFRTSLTGEVIAVEPAAPPAPGFGQPGMPTHAVVRPGHPLPPHLAGLPGKAIGVELAKSTAGSYLTPMGQRWEKAFAISFPILLISVWIVHLKPTMLPWISLADFFFVAMALGGTAAINSYDDEYLDVGAALMISILFGPTVGLVGYVIVGALKQDFNIAIIALLASHILIRIVLLAAFPMNAGVFTVLPTLMVFTGVGLMSICLTFGGWMLSSFFRPLNE
jgi:hypothetical protein